MEYCALRFLLQWEQRERILHEEMAGSPSLQQIRSALQYFQVARTFTGLKADDIVQMVADALQQVDARSDLSPEAKVTELASQFRLRFDKFNLSAASKLLWLKHKLPYIIYDSRAVNGLRGIGGIFKNANYNAFCTNWQTQYRKRAEDVGKACSRMYEVRTFLPSLHRTEAELIELASQPWFLERVFDTYLWELGGQKW